MVSAFADLIKFEDWYRYESRIEKNTYRILNLLDGYGIKSTFFILGWVAEHYPKLVKDIHSSGHEVACHGYNHRLIYNLTSEDLREDVRKAKGILEDITGAKVIGFRAASYSIMKKNLWAFDVLIEEGFLYDSSIFPIYHDRYGYPEFSRFPDIIKREGREILEIPLSTMRIFGKNIPIAGGGYLRLFPIRFIEWGIRKINEEEVRPAVIYFHPWEIDPDQPKLYISRLSTFRHYINIHKTLLKIERLLNSFRFGAIRDIFSLDFS